MRSQSSAGQDNLRIDWRSGGGDRALIARQAGELVALNPDILLAVGTLSVEQLRKHAAATPIVFAVVTDPVGQGFVKSFSHPGGNITGFTDDDGPMAGKWLEMLTQITPKVSRIAVIYNPMTAPSAWHLMLRAIEQAAHALEPALVHDEASIAALAARKGEGLLVLPDLFTLANRVLSRPRSPGRRVRTVSWRRTFIDEGGLMSYSTDSGEQVRRAAVYVDRILKGARPADLPLQKPHQIRACNQLADRTNARLHHPDCDACDRRRGHRKARAPVRRAPRPFKSPSANT